MRSRTELPGLEPAVVARLRSICGEDGVLVDRPARFHRARVVAPFPAHRWADHVPQAVVLPTTTEQVAEIVTLANEEDISVMARGGGTGMADGAVPLSRGILIDTARMNRIIEIDPVDRTATAQCGVNLMRLSQEALPYGLIYPDDPGSYPCAFLGGRVGTGGWSLEAGRYGHTRDLVLSMEVVLPTGKVITVGDGGGGKVRKSSSGYQLKQLFLGHQGTLGITTEMTVDLVPKPEAHFAAFFGYPEFTPAWKALDAIGTAGMATLAGVMVFDLEGSGWVADAGGDGSGPPSTVGLGFVMYGTRAEVRPAAKELMRIALASGGAYLGDELAWEEWGTRHKVIPSLQGRTKDGQVAVVRYFNEDGAIPYSQLPEVRRKWREIYDDLCGSYEAFLPLGTTIYTGAAYRTWGSYLTQIAVGIREDILEDEAWEAWVRAKRALAQVSLDHGGSISAAHGSTRPGEVDLVAAEYGETFELMKDVKRLLDPNNVMNRGKYGMEAANV